MISSPSNQRIKDLLRLLDRKGAERDHMFALEGAREIQRALQSGFELVESFIEATLFQQMNESFRRQVEGHSVIKISDSVFQKIAVRESSDGIVSVFKTKQPNISDLIKKLQKEHSLIIATQDVEKPGNIGAILRTADAVGAAAVIALDSPVDPWNPNLIRASLGAAFSVPLFRFQSSDFYKLCRDQEVAMFVALISKKSQSLFNLSFPKTSTAIVLGSESQGVSSFWQNDSVSHVILPMRGICDSLNVSVAAGVLAYEWRRQLS